MATLSLSRHSSPPVRPAGNTVLPEYIVPSHKTTTLTCPTNDKKLRRRQQTTAVAGSPLNTNHSFFTALHLPGQLRDTRTDNDRRIDHAANRLMFITRS
ncbi:unnamed protein product [Macrosiphum euphorbiae]|uniref:Uncharacterized protein n=1 Tax=Macrosiphum euphorbiae TaxID=13131 RepID=A0AAV0Y5D9_9HEMI|nr:unnamed protein product [Macrosiphum euphorbiae]